jgi:hypothetical protein
VNHGRRVASHPYRTTRPVSRFPRKQVRAEQKLSRSVCTRRDRRATETSRSLLSHGWVGGPASGMSIRTGIWQLPRRLTPICTPNSAGTVRVSWPPSNSTTVHVPCRRPRHVNRFFITDILLYQWRSWRAALTMAPDGEDHVVAADDHALSTFGACL